PDPLPDTLAVIFAGFAAFVGLLIVAVLPASLPMTLLGGYIASRLVAKQQFRQSFGLWVTRGAGCGLVLGALGSALWFGSSAIYLWNAGWNTPPSGMMGP